MWRCFPFVVFWGAALLLAAAVEAQTPASQPSRADNAARLRVAIEQLVLEAKDLDNLETPKNLPKFSRPHPALKTFDADMVQDTLNRMLQPFTGNEYRDTYIRWHLMWAVKKVNESQRRDSAHKLVELFRMMPGGLNVAYKSEAHWEPLEIYQKYQAMVGGAPSASVVVGYPPFQRVVGPPESFKYLPADAPAKHKLAVEEYTKRVEKANELYGGKFKYVRHEGAIAFNHRLTAMTEIMRHYRGELIYAIITAGDPETGKLIMSEIARFAREKNGIAFDLLTYVYLATFDGALNRYDQPTLDKMSQILEQGARAAEGYTSYGGQPRNFADSAFHLIEMLKDGGGFIEPERAANVPRSRR